MLIAPFSKPSITRTTPATTDNDCVNRFFGFREEISAAFSQAHLSSSLLSNYSVIVFPVLGGISRGCRLTIQVWPPPTRAHVRTRFRTDVQRRGGAQTRRTRPSALRKYLWRLIRRRSVNYVRRSTDYDAARFSSERCLLTERNDILSRCGRLERKKKKELFLGPFSFIFYIFFKLCIWKYRANYCYLRDFVRWQPSILRILQHFVSDYANFWKIRWNNISQIDFRTNSHRAESIILRSLNLWNRWRYYSTTTTTTADVIRR